MHLCIRVIFPGTITEAVIELDVRARRDNGTESWCHGEDNSTFCASQNEPRTLNDERNCRQAEYRWKYLEFYSGTEPAPEPWSWTVSLSKHRVYFFFSPTWIYPSSHSLLSSPLPSLSPLRADYYVPFLTCPHIFPLANQWHAQTPKAAIKEHGVLSILMRLGGAL